MSKPIVIFKMSKHYEKMEVFTGCKMSKSLVGVTTVRPNKGADRKTRYNILAAELFRVWGVPAPVYRMTVGEAKKVFKTGGAQ